MLLSRHSWLFRNHYHRIIPKSLHYGSYLSHNNRLLYHNFVEDEEFIEIKNALIGRDNDLNSYQSDVIDSIINKRDNKLHNLIIQPTGSGKSICFQLPILYSAYKSIKYHPESPTMGIVVTPTISLMEDQVQQIKQKSFVIAHYFSSSITTSNSEIKLKTKKTKKQWMKMNYR